LNAEKTSYPLVSIIILNYNGRKNLGKLLDKCLSSVLKTAYPNFEVLFADNGSTDESVKHITEKFGRDKRLKVIPLGKNYGFAQGNNLASTHADERSEYLVFINTDVEIDDTWLKKMVDLIRKANLSGSREVAAISSVIFDVSREKFIDELYIRYPSGAHFIPLKSKPSFSRLVEIDFPAGEAFLIKKEVFMEVGGFDGDYFLYYDDVDLGWRLQLAGYKVLLNPKAKVIHYRSATTKKAVDLKRIFYFCERNRLISCIKNLEKSSLFALIFYEFLSLGGKKRKEFFTEYLKALRDIVSKTRWKKIVTKRRQIQRVRRVSDKELFKLSIQRTPRNLNRFGHILHRAF